jgi:hypothetical protein
MQGSTPLLLHGALVMRVLLQLHEGFCVGSWRLQSCFACTACDVHCEACNVIEQCRVRSSGKWFLRLHGSWLLSLPSVEQGTYRTGTEQGLMCAGVLYSTELSPEHHGVHPPGHVRLAACTF